MEVTHAERCTNCGSTEAKDVFIDDSDNSFGLTCSKCGVNYRLASIDEARYIQLCGLLLDGLAQREVLLKYGSEDKPRYIIHPSQNA